MFGIKKAGIPFLLTAVWFTLWAGPFVAFAWDSGGMYEDAIDASICAFSSNSANLGYNDSYSDQYVVLQNIPTAMVLSSWKVGLAKVGSPVDQVKAFIYTYSTSNAYTLFASSSPVTIGTSGVYTFNFASVSLARGTYAFVLSRTGSTSATNMYVIRVDPACVVRSSNSQTEKLMGNPFINGYNLAGGYSRILGDVVSSGSVSTSTASSDIDMASTTNAVIWAGYMSIIPWGIFLSILAGVAGYVFTRKFIR
jgi:hypothetical protein